jgi:hypothetical protein
LDFGAIDASSQHGACPCSHRKPSSVAKTHRHSNTTTRGVHGADRHAFSKLTGIPTGFSAYADQGLETYTPYYYQAGTQLGAPTIHFPSIEKKYIRYGYQPPRNFVPRSIPMKFQPWVMRDVDSWVKHNARHMLFVYGQNDPWGAEPFRLGKGAKDSYVFTAPGLNHGANVAGLVAEQKSLATARILDWAGVSASAVAQAKPLAKFDAKLDVRDVEREATLRP